VKVDSEKPSFYENLFWYIYEENPELRNWLDWVRAEFRGKYKSWIPDPSLRSKQNLNKFESEISRLSGL
jgi:hypothetical protein